MKQLFPTPSSDLEIETVYADLVFPDPPDDRPHVVLNFVQTIDGQTTLGTGGASGLGSEVDHRLMKRLRATADALLHGAGTVRKDNFPPTVPADLEAMRLSRGLTPQPFGVVVSGSGDISPENRYFTMPGNVILTTTQHQFRLKQLFGDRAIVEVSGDSTVDLGAALKVLRQRYKVRVLVCEGGPRLTHSLVAGGYLDELFLTIAPKLGSDAGALRLLEGPAFDPAALPTAELVHVLVQGSELFMRYRISPVARRG